MSLTVLRLIINESFTLTHLALKKHTNKLLQLQLSSSLVYRSSAGISKLIFQSSYFYATIRSFEILLIAIQLPLFPNALMQE